MNNKKIKIMLQDQAVVFKNCLLCGIKIPSTRRGDARYCSSEHYKKMNYFYYEPVNNKK